MKTRINQNSIRGGFTYVSVVIAAILIGLILSTYLKLVASQNQMTMRSQAWNRNIAVVEAGIEEALAHLNKNGGGSAFNGTISGNLLVDGWTSSASGGWTKTSYVGEDYYTVTIEPYTLGTNCPVIVSEGYVKQLPTFAFSRWISRPFLAQIGNQPTTYVKRTITANTTNLPTFSKALVATRWIDLAGNNVFTDSYDSSNPSYSTNGRWDINKRRDRGDIATNNSITNSVNVANAEIYGSVATGPNPWNPGHALMTINQGKVGDMAWMNNPATSGVQPGKDRDDMNVQFPDVVPPFTAGLPPQNGYTWTNGVRYDQYFGTGSYAVDTLYGKILINGAARIYVRNSFRLSGQDVIQLAPGARVMIFMNGQEAQLGGNGVINPDGKASSFYYFGTRNNTAMTFSGNGQFQGAIYAPNADVTGNGGGNSSEDFSGAAVIKTIKFNGHYKFHYDEALGRNGMYTGFRLTSWNEL